MPTWLKLLIYPFIVLFFASLGGFVGMWLPARGTENDTGAAGAADGMEMILFGAIGLAIGLVVGASAVLILHVLLNRNKNVQTKPVVSQEDNVWPPAPR